MKSTSTSTSFQHALFHPGQLSKHCTIAWGGTPTLLDVSVLLSGCFPSLSFSSGWNRIFSSWKNPLAPNPYGPCYSHPFTNANGHSRRKKQPFGGSAAPNPSGFAGQRKHTVSPCSTIHMTTNDYRTLNTLDLFHLIDTNGACCCPPRTVHISDRPALHTKLAELQLSVKTHCKHCMYGIVAYIDPIYDP